MKTIGRRIAVWYALAATLSLACLFAVGHYLLESYLVRQLDALNETEFIHLKDTLGPDYKTLPPDSVAQRIREVTESASSLFYIDMHGPMTNRFFRSTNLRGQTIPDVPGAHSYTVEVEGIGELRVREFLLPPFEVTVATPLEPVRKLMNGYRKVFLALLLLMLVVSFVVGYGLSELILRPVRLIQATANRIRSDNLKERIPVGNVKDELSQLARFLNQMFDRLETSFSEVRRFTAETSHELKTPLALVRLHAERLLVNGNLDPAQKESIQEQLEELDRLNRIIDELLFLSRADAQAISVDLKEQEPAAFLKAFAQDASVLAEHHGSRFAYTHEGEGTVAFEEKRIRQVLLNLLVNALHVSPPGSRITLHSKTIDHTWHVSVEDEGPGLPAEQRERIFERFVRFPSKATEDRGNGLGLAICRSIVQLHRGHIFAVEGANGHGLKVAFEIPAAASG